MPTSASIAIVNYRTAPLVVECLASVAAQRAALAGGRVVVVDNASGDGSVEHLREAIAARGWSDWAEVVASPTNGGFSAGNNAAIARIRERDPGFDTVFLLNPDTVLRPGALEAMQAFVAAHAPCIAGGSIEDASGRVEPSSHPFPSPLGELAASAQLRVLHRAIARRRPRPPVNAVARCDWVSGAWMALSRAVIDTVGPMDERFFLYFEEVDYCARARGAGFACWQVPSARIVHLEGASTGVKVARRRRPAYWFDSRRRYFVKHHGVGGLLAADALFAIGRGSLVMRRVLRLGGRVGMNEEPVGFARDLLVGDLRAIVSGSVWRLPRHA
jgi:N-acetylglucosaminyl-diphospho-decaprenol L-rhamnosyltransferase